MASSDGTVVTLVDGGTIVDTMGNQWSISASGQVVENGVTDTFTSNVTELAFKNSVIWQENTSFLWYAKVGNTRVLIMAGPQGPMSLQCQSPGHGWGEETTPLGTQTTGMTTAHRRLATPLRCHRAR